MVEFLDYLVRHSEAKVVSLIPLILLSDVLSVSLFGNSQFVDLVMIGKNVSN